MMRNKNLIIAGLTFLMCLMSVYFGSRIFNANENFLLAELNAFDKIYYDDVKMVPLLSRQAAFFTLPLLLGIVGLEIFLVIKTKVKKSKNIALGMLIASLIILTIAVLTLNNPVHFDFSQWGFVWICLGIIIIAGNILSAFINKEEAK